MANEKGESRRSVLGKLLKLGAGAAVVASMPRMARAEAAPSTEAAKSPSEFMEGYMREVLTPGALPPEGQKLTAETRPLGKDHVQHVFLYDSVDGDEVAVTLTTTHTGEFRLAAAQLFENNVMGDPTAKLKSENLDEIFGKKFAPNPLLDPEPWNHFNNEYSEGRPPTAEKTTLAPDGVLESRGATIAGVNAPYKIRYVTARAFPNSIQQEKKSVFVPTR